MTDAEAPLVLVVLGHGRQQGLCHALVRAVCTELDERGARWRLHDLLADGFDPVLRLAPGQAHAGPCAPDDDALVHRYQQDVRAADAFVVVHPVWWFAPPAILKGWVDRVLVDPVAIDHSQGDPPRALLSGRPALLVQTFNAAAFIDRVVFQGLAAGFWRRMVFPAVGCRSVGRVAVYQAGELTDARLRAVRKRLARAVDTLVRRVSPRA